MASGTGVRLTHLDDSGAARMVDVSEKAVTTREAVATGAVRMAPETLALIVGDGLPKGDVIATARIAGIMAAKRTADLVPLCHPLMLQSVRVEITADPALPGLRVVATARVNGTTGVEMEALTAASVACLTIYDMAKAVDRAMVLEDIRLLSKSGGRSGDWTAGA